MIEIANRIVEAEGGRRELKIARRDPRWKLIASVFDPDKSLDLVVKKYIVRLGLLLALGLSLPLHSAAGEVISLSARLPAHVGEVAMY
jgi:hypothetical protein